LLRENAFVAFVGPAVVCGQERFNEAARRGSVGTEPRQGESVHVLVQDLGLAEGNLDGD